MPEQVFRLLHGLRVKSALALAGVELAPPNPDIDLEITVVDHLPQPPDNNVILAYDFANGQTVRSATDTDGSTLIAFSDVGRFRLSADHSRIEIAKANADGPAISDVLLQGWVMSMALMLRGYVVLHASAVAVDGKAIALLANSGMGKSTVTALLLRDGATLISDDVLRVEYRPDGTWVAHPGITALRLRPAAAGLAHTIPNASVEATPDDRLAVSVEQTSTAPVKLATVLLPIPSRSATHLEIRWLTPPLAAVELNRYPRVYDWQILAPVKRQFAAAAALSTQLPVGLMTVPWGPPWPSNLLGEIIDLLPRTND